MIRQKNLNISPSTLCRVDVIDKRPDGLTTTSWIESILLAADKKGLVDELREKLSEGISRHSKQGKTQFKPSAQKL